MPYEAYPLQINNPNLATIQKCEILLQKSIEHESFFTDYEKACDSKCNTCDQCVRARQAVSAAIQDPRALCWEVWRLDPETYELLDFVGILRLSRVKLGCDATAHYFFFDGKLRDKTDLLHAWKHWAFTDHPRWKALNRVTLEVPSFAFALARHAARYLGFTGPYGYEYKKSKLTVEGVKKKAILWRNEWHDELIMGLHNGL